jgi:lipopolysaccharide/colanic/teichoic acid biosynthesis glycosyltransferase
MFKFRTMRVGVAGHALAGAGDLRITPVGRFLRTTRLDELPQLLNVLRGEMSLVGPRPELREFVDLHSDEYREILAVQPGITGPTQLRYAGLEARLLSDQEDPDSYYRERLLPDKVALDLAYARSGSLAEDFRVIGRTSVLPITLATQRPREAGPAGLSAPPLAYTAAALAAALLLLLFVLGLGPAR